MTRTEDELQRFFEQVATDVDMAPDLPVRLHARARRRVRTRRLAGAGLGMATLVAVAVAVPTLRDDTSNVEVVPAPTPTPTTTPTPTPTPTVAASRPNATRPSIIVTVHDQGRALVVIGTENGAVVRTLHRVPADTTVQHIRIGPDGKVWFETVRQDGQCQEVVYTVPLEGGEVTRTSVGRQPDVSPDGRFVAFLDSTADHGGPSQASRYLCTGALVVRDLRTGSERAWNVTRDSTGHLALPSWSPDGSRLAVTYSGNNPNPTDGRSDDWLTEVRVLDVVKRGTFEEVSQVVAKSLAPSVGPGGEPSPGNPVWLHDGRLAFVRTDNREENPMSSRVVVLEQGTERELLGRLGTINLSVDTSGRHLLAVRIRAADPRGTYQIFALDGDRAEQLQAGAASSEHWGPAADW